MKRKARIEAIMEQCSKMHPAQFAVIDRAFSALVMEAHAGKSTRRKNDEATQAGHTVSLSARIFAG